MLDMKSLRLLQMAQEWAKELSKSEFRGQERIVSEETAKGFAEVDKGRNPDVVLKEVLAKVKERIDANRPNLSMH